MLTPEHEERLQAIDGESGRLARNVLRQPALRPVFRQRAVTLLEELHAIGERVQLSRAARTRFGSALSESLLDLQFVCEEGSTMKSLRLARLASRDADADN